MTENETRTAVTEKRLRWWLQIARGDEIAGFDGDEDRLDQIALEVETVLGDSEDGQAPSDPDD